MFSLVWINPGLEPMPVFDDDGKLIIAETGQEAAEIARRYTETFGKKCQPRPFKPETNWKERERERFKSGQYKPALLLDCIPLSIEAAPIARRSSELQDHFVHQSENDPLYLAYTESEAKGHADKQTKIRVGRYLERYYSDILTSDDIRDIATSYLASVEELELQVTQDADEIERVYTNGPRSCMSHSACRFNGPCHPSRVYAGPDLAIAYIERDDAITARTVVWPEKEIYGRIYGDHDRLTAALKAAGFKPAGDDDNAFDGARLRRIEADRGGFVMPYLDYGVGVDDTGDKYLIISGNPDYHANTTNGVVGEPEYEEWCSNCEEGTNDGIWVEDVQEIWCAHCARQNGFRCDYNGNWYSDNTSSYEMANGQTWCEAAFEAYGAMCEATNEAYHIDDTVTLANGAIWCHAYFNDHGRTCLSCGEMFDAEDNGGCDDCQPQLELEPKTETAVALAGSQS